MATPPRRRKPTPGQLAYLATFKGPFDIPETADEVSELIDRFHDDGRDRDEAKYAAWSTDKQKRVRERELEDRANLRADIVRARTAFRKSKGDERELGRSELARLLEKSAQQKRDDKEAREDAKQERIEDARQAREDARPIKIISRAKKEPSIAIDVNVRLVLIVSAIAGAVLLWALTSR